MLHVKISSPECVIFDDNADKISLPTEQGIITILPSHIPLVCPVKPGLVTIRKKDAKSDKKFSEYVVQDNQITFSISKGIVFVDGKNVTVVTSVGTISPAESEQELHEMKSKLQKKIGELRQEGNIEEVEKSLMRLKKIEADLALVKMKNAKS